jgi:hypothetical protein
MPQKGRRADAHDFESAIARPGARPCPQSCALNDAGSRVRPVELHTGVHKFVIGLVGLIQFAPHP